VTVENQTGGTRENGEENDAACPMGSFTIQIRAIRAEKA
jgi:hypothetical protein